ncbi:putative Ig domain-containing protein [Nocardioides sp. TRM66260-LWL]|uniref:putative Ig domain-containing protein n=1 Tax=Nocardioides sp. TRM66260-LWL TaxID=2874478 RepID=UPI001CC5E3C6|nr:putative Ig domain-containing protein [Nocardioides sp. TRM66260-LWL]MBZ5736266.1 putative Ig domain-containing protein [Nocardioides sp. TRM66260-LWL]
MPRAERAVARRAAGDVDVLALHSRPGAARTVYLDVVGATVADVGWNALTGVGSLVAAPFDRDGDPASLGAEEQDWVRWTWQVLAAKLAPFDVDVTTERPSTDALRADGPDDPTWGVEILLTQAYDNPVAAWCGRCGGTTYTYLLGADRQAQRDASGPAWVFADLMRQPRDAGLTAALHVGRMAGLEPHGRTTAVGTTTFWAGGALWGPILGLPVDADVSGWSHGSYPGATHPEQDDVATLAAALGTVADDGPDGSGGQGGAEAARALVDGHATGAIESPGDVDGFVVAIDRPTAITAAPVSDDEMLDVALTVRDADTGVEIGRAAPPTLPAASWVATGTGATVDVPVAAGTSRRLLVQVAGDGSGDGVGDGSALARPDAYDAAGSLGRYAVTARPLEDVLAARVGTTPVVTGTAVTQTPLVLTGGVPPYRTAALGLPEGLRFDPYSGALLGAAPDVPQTTPLRFVVSDAEGTTRVVAGELRVTPPGPSLGIDLPDSRPAEVGLALGPVRFAATGGTAPYAWSSTGLPPGLALAADGTLTGTPRTAGDLLVPVRVQDADGATATALWPLRVVPRLALRPTRLPAGRAGSAYRVTLVATGGLPSLRWRVRAPTGARLERVDDGSRVLRLRLPRVVPASRTVVVDVEVVDALGVRAQRTYAVRVLPR